LSERFFGWPYQRHAFRRFTQGLSAFLGLDPSAKFLKFQVDGLADCYIFAS
jgi:hypothetical protein